MEDKNSNNGMKIHHMDGGCCGGTSCCGMGGGYGGCNCGCGGRNYGMSCSHKHYFLRWFLGLLLLIGVFCVGMSVGEMGARFGGDGEYGWHHQGYPMMYGVGLPVYDGSVNGTTPPSGPVTNPNQ